jgi:hypothetical protein
MRIYPLTKNKYAETKKRWNANNPGYHRDWHLRVYPGVKKRQTDYILSRGGKCEICGYDKCLAALHFHHTDNNKTRRPAFLTRKKNRTEAEEAELSSCKLLCANCHIEEHEKGRKNENLSPLYGL